MRSVYGILGLPAKLLFTGCASPQQSSTPSAVATSPPNSFPPTTTQAPTPDPVSLLEFGNANSSERDSMFEMGQVLRCWVGLSVPPDSFCVDTESASLVEYAAIGADHCPSAADNPDGLCPIGWVVHDIQVTANNDFLAANPAARALFEAVRLSVIDVSLAQVAVRDGESPSDVATRWIAANRDLVDEWIAAALSPSTADEANRPPRFTSSATLTAPENGTAAGTVTAVDDDTADTVSGYSITGGADRSLFSITSTGQLNFNTAPDYEHPADTGGDNTYQVIVTATSGTGTRTNTATQTITVIITEPPSAPAPDLVVHTPTVDVSAPVAGASFTLSVTVQNLGSGPSAPTTLRYYRSTDPTISTGDAAVGTDSVSGLGVQESGAESISLVAPPAAGTYYFGACVDPASGESDTLNNCSGSVQGLTVSAPATAPDLAFRHFSAERVRPGRNPKVAGASFHLYAQVHNTGTETSTTTTLRYYRSPDSTITVSDTEVGTYSVSALQILTPLDKCLHSVPGRFPVIYGEVDAFNSGLGFVYHHFGRLETMNRSVSGIGPGNRQTTVHLTNWAGENWLVRSVLTSAGNERIIDLRFWEDS